MPHPSENTQTLLTEPLSKHDHILGPPNAPITIVEYGDYECPDCFNAIPVLREVRRRLQDRVRFAFRHFPQSSIHPHASAAAEAAEAAADQGKFWEMHEALFADQQHLADVDLAHLALTLGLEIYKFENSRDTQKHRRRIAEHYQSGLRSGVRKTPTLFVNNRRYDGPLDADAIVRAASPP